MPINQVVEKGNGVVSAILASFHQGFLGPKGWINPGLSRDGTGVDST